MESRQAEAILQCQRDFFRTGATLPVPFRLDALDRLYRAVSARQPEI